MKRIPFLFILLCLVLNLWAKDKRVHIRVMQTSDIHANFFPNTDSNAVEREGGMHRVSSLVKQRRTEFGENLILMDNGDILQGHPSAYYYNFMDSVSKHVCAEILNYMRYDLGNIGNHDVETGRSVMERWIAQCDFPVLGANVIDTATGTTALPPYAILERDGVRIAVLGMITPAIPAWLHEGLWDGLRFEDMEDTARKWMKIIREEEKPDAIIGLFHAGQRPVRLFDKYNENASLTVAREVPGFDAVLIGHDHQIDSKSITNNEGKEVILLNPGSDGKIVSEVDMVFQLKDGKVVDKTIQGYNTSTLNEPIDQDYVSHFAAHRAKVDNFMTKRVGYITDDISTRSSFFGPTSFIDLIHQVQLEISGADISLTAPLVTNTIVQKGDIDINDLFEIYKYENMLYVMRLTGQEVKDLLEESYHLWTNQMQSPTDHLLQLKSFEGKTRLANMYFNFESAYGILYTVDVTKPYRQKVEIQSMADGTPFNPEKTYNVAVNSYRGNGGGELMTRGAGIAQDKLKERVVYASERDLRYYLIEYVEKKDTIVPPTDHHWRFVPEDWAQPAAQRDYELLYPSK